jgi:hypothetical protein
MELATVTRPHGVHPTNVCEKLGRRARLVAGKRIR